MISIQVRLFDLLKKSSQLTNYPILQIKKLKQVYSTLWKNNVPYNKIRSHFYRYIRTSKYFIQGFEKI